MTPVRAFSLCLAALLVVLAGCGSSPKTVTKAEYQTEIQTVGADLTAAGSQLGKSIDIAHVQRVRRQLPDAPARRLEEAQRTEAAGEHPGRATSCWPARSTHLADELEPVKDARRESIVKAREALAKVGKSQAVEDGRTAIQKLQKLGDDTSELGAL